MIKILVLILSAGIVGRLNICTKAIWKIPDCSAMVAAFQACLCSKCREPYVHNVEFQSLAQPSGCSCIVITSSTVISKVIVLKWFDTLDNDILSFGLITDNYKEIDAS